jgi:hypothetical protein
MIDRKQKALTLLDDKLSSSDFLVSYTIPSLLFTVQVLIKYNKLDQAQRILQFIASKVTKEGIIIHKEQQEFPTQYLFVLSTYLKKVPDSKREVQQFIPSIQKIIFLLEKQFDSHYLLLHSYEQQKRLYFSFFDNFYFLLAVENLADILNVAGFVESADNLFILKTKIDLGFDRYLSNTSDKYYLNYFTSLYQFEILSARKLYEARVEFPQLQFYVSTALKKELFLTTDIEGHSCSKLLISALTLRELNEDKKAKEIEDVLDEYLDDFPAKLLSYGRFVFEQKVRAKLGEKKPIEQNKGEWMISKPQFLKTILTYLYYY